MKKKIAAIGMTILIMLGVSGCMDRHEKNNEEMLTGRTDSNKVVILEGNDNLIGKMVEIKVISEHMWYLKGEIKWQNIHL